VPWWVDSDKKATTIAVANAISGWTNIAVAANHASVPQKTDLTIPMVLI
tara:strand:- start:1227 stop:1373 length:147 start_codon:yes stop_codon:yes gene_type:complete